MVDFLPLAWSCILSVLQAKPRCVLDVFALGEQHKQQVKPRDSYEKNHGLMLRFVDARLISAKVDEAEHRGRCYRSSKTPPNIVDVTDRQGNNRSSE
jgi:hypothetical protein